MTKQEFIIEQLLPYIENPDLCGFDGVCKYLTKDGKQCVLGKNLAFYHHEWEGKGAWELINEYKQELLIPSSRNILEGEEWQNLQNIHDAIAQGDNSLQVLFRIEVLEESSEIDLSLLKNKL